VADVRAAAKARREDSYRDLFALILYERSVAQKTIALKADRYGYGCRLSVVTGPRCQSSYGKDFEQWSVGGVAASVTRYMG
jgi:hypothetical protein